MFQIVLFYHIHSNLNYVRWCKSLIDLMKQRAHNCIRKSKHATDISNCTHSEKTVQITTTEVGLADASSHTSSMSKENMQLYNPYRLREPLQQLLCKVSKYLGYLHYSSRFSFIFVRNYMNYPDFLLS